MPFKPRHHPCTWRSTSRPLDPSTVRSSSAQLSSRLCKAAPSLPLMEALATIATKRADTNSPSLSHPTKAAPFYASANAAIVAVSAFARAYSLPLSFTLSLSLSVSLLVVRAGALAEAPSALQRVCVWAQGEGRDRTAIPFPPSPPAPRRRRPRASAHSVGSGQGRGTPMIVATTVAERRLVGS
jgi:hypothetical protein